MPAPRYRSTAEFLAAVNQTYQSRRTSADKILTPAEIAAQLTALAARGSAAGGGPSPVEPLVAALDLRDPRPLVIAQASDSTGDSATEWFELAWKELAAERWPERPARVRRWVKDTEVYSPLTTWQSASAGTASTVKTVVRDGFTEERADLVGTTDELGNVWSIAGAGGTIRTTGGYAVQATPGSGGTALATALPAHQGIDGTSSMTFRIVSIGTVQQMILTHTSSLVNAGNRLDLLIGGTTSNGPQLRQHLGGVTTILATFPAGHLNWSSEITVNASLTVSGTTASATINGTTITATIDPAAFGNAHTYYVVSGSGIRLDSVERTATVVETIPSPLGWLTVYNAGYAGGRASHQVDRLQAMFPERPDALFLNHGHNYHAIDSTPEAFVAALTRFVDAVHAKYPGVPVVALSQNPNFVATGRTQAQVDGHHARQRHLRAVCRERGWGYIPGLEAFMALPDGGKSLVNADGVHPLTGAGAGTGSRLQADVAKQWVRAHSLRP